MIHLKLKSLKQPDSPIVEENFTWTEAIKVFSKTSGTDVDIIAGDINVEDHLIWLKRTDREFPQYYEIMELFMGF